MTAEGVESQKQLSFLCGEHCDYVQGYLASRPLSADKLGDLLRSDFQLFDVVGFPPAPADTHTSAPAKAVEASHTKKSTVSDGDSECLPLEVNAS